MKYRILLLSLFLLPSAAMAETPDCWTVDGKPSGFNASGQEVADGQFLITVETQTITKENLLQVMAKVNYGNLKPNAFPSIFDQFLIFSLGAIQEDADRSALIPAVNEQLREIAAIPGVSSMACNVVSRPSRDIP